MKLRRSYIFALASVALLGSSCIRRPDGVQSDKKMVPVIADLELAEAYMQTQRSTDNGDLRTATVDRIISEHGLTRAEFDTTMAWYGRNIDSYYELCSMVEKELARRRQKVSGGKSIEMESSDLWPYSRQSLLSRLSGSDAFEFSIPTVDVESGQRIELKLRMNGNTDGMAMLGVEYDNGTKGYFTRTISNSRRLKLSFQTDTARTVTRIFGNLLLKDEATMPLWIDSIYLSALPFDSLEYYKIHSQRTFRDPVQRRRPREEMAASDTVTDNEAPQPALSPSMTSRPSPARPGQVQMMPQKAIQPMRVK